MHPVASKINLNAFEGEIDILGKKRKVKFHGEEKDEASNHVYQIATLSIEGVELAEVWEAISRLHGPVAVVNKPVADASEAKPVEKKTETKAAASVPKPAERKAEPKKEPEQLVLPKTESKAEEDDLDDDDLDGDITEGVEHGLDIKLMNTFDKIRGVLEHMRDKGYDTPEKIVAVAKLVKGEVKALKVVEEKGGFEKRIERAAMVVLNPDAEASA